MAFAHIQDGANKTQTAKFLKVSRGAVNKWIQLFINDGIDGLKEKPRSGRPSALSEAQLSQLKECLITNSIKPIAGRLKGSQLIDYINQEFSVLYSVDNVYRLLHQLGFSWITSRSKHPKQDLVTFTAITDIHVHGANSSLLYWTPLSELCSSPDVQFILGRC
jgi:transposase